MTSPTSAAESLAALSPIELFFPDFEAEQAATRRLLECVPDGKFDWRPHAKSRTLGELATHIADIPNRGTLILGTDDMDIASRVPVPPLATTAALVAHHDAAIDALRRALAGADLERLAGEWRIRNGAHVFVRGARRHMLRTVVLSHIGHHRAQLGVYLRLLDVPLPGTYGPSADDIAMLKK